MFDALLVTGLVILPIGLIALATAMLGAPGYGKGLGRMSGAFGLVGVVAATVQLADPSSQIGAVVMLALIVFHLTLGWRTHRLSRAPRSRMPADA